MKDINIILEQIHNKSEINESALSKLGWGAALVASGALGVAGANEVIKYKHSSANTTQTQSAQTQPAQTQPAQTQPAQTQPTYADDHIQSMVRQNEGLKLKTYKDTAGIKTIGIGHNLEAPSSLKAFKTVFGETEGKKLHVGCVDGTCGLSKTQAENLFKHDYTSHRNNAVKLVPNLHKFPKDVQAMIVDASYRGHPGPKFIKHFNAGRWDEAAAEYINRKEYNEPERNADGTLVAPGVIKRIKEHHKILQDYAKSQKPPAPTTTPPGKINESCGCKHKGLKSRMRKKIVQRLEEAIFDGVGIRRPDDRTKKSQSPSPADIEDLERMGDIVDLGDTEQSALNKFNKLYGTNPPLERDTTSFIGHEPSAAQRGYQKEIDVQGTGEFQTRKPAIHIPAFDTLVIPPDDSSHDSSATQQRKGEDQDWELHSIHTLSEDNPRESRHPTQGPVDPSSLRYLKRHGFTVTSRVATRQVDDNGNPYHPHAGQAIHTVRGHRGEILAVFKGGHDRSLEQISVNDDHWIQQSAGIEVRFWLDPEQGYTAVDYDHDGEHRENAESHPFFGRTEDDPEGLQDRVSLFTQAIKKHLGAKVKMGLGKPLQRVGDVLAQRTVPREK